MKASVRGHVPPGRVGRVAPGTFGYPLLGGEVSEWLMVPLSKSGLVRASVGSNPTLSATDAAHARRARPPGGTRSLRRGRVVA